MSAFRRVVFLVGAPRSGTTWLQTLLAAHPDVVTPQETDLFDRYVAPLEDGWEWQMRGGPDDWARRRYKGVPAIVTRDRFEEIVRGFVDQMLDAAAELKPGATVLVEKSPSHSLHAELVHRVLPEAHFLHIVRDGRDVTASLTTAGKGWGASWAPTSEREAAEMWATHVRSARKADATGAPYREARFEDLRTDGAKRLAELFAFCGVPATVESCEALVQRMSLERMSSPEGPSSIRVGGELAGLAETRTEPPGFFGGGDTGGWRGTWGARERRVFDTVAGDLLIELGYVPDRSWIEQGPVASLAVDVATLGARVARSALRTAWRRADRWVDRFP